MVLAIDLKINTEDIDVMFQTQGVNKLDSPCTPISFKRPKLEETKNSPPAPPQQDFFDENWECASVFQHD